ncbi:MAG: ribose-phosphate pyrophosphokinase [Candidatus Microsaccharimonas sp.]
MEKLTQREKESIQIVGGFAHPELTQDIAQSIGTEVSAIKEKIHPNGEIYSRFIESVRGKHVFIVQPHIRTPETSVSDAIMQQCLLVDAARSSSASEITVVAPYLGYMRQDRKTKGREPISTRVVLDQLASAGADRIVTVDIHSPQAQAIFRGPFDHLTAQPALRDAMADEIAGINREDCLIVAPDAGAAKMSELHQEDLQTSMIVMSKRRDPQDSQKISRNDHFPDAEGKHCLLFDDMIDTAGTLVSAAEALKSSGALSVRVAATHGILSDPAIERLQSAPIDKVLVTDTFTTHRAERELGDKLRVVRVAPIIGSAILEILRDGSVSKLFHDQNHR